MTIIPVIMCGGAGSRLWPASTPGRPKPFLPLIGDQSLFSQTVERMAPLAGPDGEIIIVAGQAHLAALRDELETLGRKATILLEPQPRDSGPAMAAAAVRALSVDPDAVIAVVASDHHIPDAVAFRAAVEEAAAAAAEGRIVTLGVKPTWPSPAFGYIAPAERGGSGARPVRAFVEKPDEATAATYIADGYLWNSGNFITRASVLADELRRHAPGILEAAEVAVAEAHPSAEALRLSDAFREAPKLSIDYAVMEKTDRASVLPVSFAWSDVGSWDSVLESGGGDAGETFRLDSRGGLIRAGVGMRVALVGVEDVVVIAEGGDVLVASVRASPRVRAAADAFPPAKTQRSAIADDARRFADWLRLRALPLWTTAGVSAEGWFHETLTEEGRPLTPVRRARVQPRQTYALGLAARQGWNAPWRPLAERAMTAFEAAHRLPGGGYRTRLEADGSPLDETALNYDLAFVLMARAVLGEPEAAQEVLGLLDARAHPAGGYVEADHRPYQSNATMHLFEAFLTWERAQPDAGWEARADALAELAIGRFIDAEGGFIREVYDADWNPAQGEEGRIVEPGHQFEWAYLIQTWAARRGRTDGTEAAWRLFLAGTRGVDPVRGVAIDELDDELGFARPTARLWPQTERLKAALVLALARDEDRDWLFIQAAEALSAIRRYLSDEGVWGDVMDEAGRIAPGPAPASTLYHLMTALDCLAETANRAPELDGPLDLS